MLMLTAEGVSNRFFAAFEKLWQFATSVKIWILRSSRILIPPDDFGAAALLIHGEFVPSLRNIAGRIFT
jgi:hypothetical protein